MKRSNNQPDRLLLDFESFSETEIKLDQSQVNRAVKLSTILKNPERQWRTYLNSLALFGFETWLRSRHDDLAINMDNCSVGHPSYANYIDGVFNLRVDNYKICILTNGAAIDEFITIDRALIDLPEYVAHFYLVIDVIEERSEIKLNRFISYEEIVRHQQTNNLVPDPDWTYEVPLAWFNSEPEDLLLYLRCLDFAPFQLPDPVATTKDTAVRLEHLLSQLEATDLSLHEILTWSQAAPILSNADLLQQLYKIQSNDSTVTDSLNVLKNSLTQTAIDVKSWLSDELDELAQNLAWTLLPPPIFAANGLRDLAVVNRTSPTEEFAAILTQLRRSGEDIPSEARGACQDFTLGDRQLRLFAVIWQIDELDIPEWSLLLVLGGQPNDYLPQDLKLEIAESQTILDSKTVDRDTSDSYLYTRVIGELNEQFTVKVSLRDGTTFVFPDLVFS